MLEKLEYAVARSKLKEYEHLTRRDKDGVYRSVCRPGVKVDVVNLNLGLGDVGCPACRSSHEFRILNKYGKQDNAIGHIYLVI